MIKKKIHFIIDCETVGANTKQYPRRVINVGLVIGDNKGNIIEKFEWNIKDNIKYGWSLPNKWQFYLTKVENLHSAKEVDSFQDFIKDFISIIQKYKTNKIELWSYNASFDFGAIKEEMELYKTDTKIIDWLDRNWFCIWHYSAHLLMNRPSYKSFVDKNGFVSPKGNMKTSAEVLYRYLLGNTAFIEEHTGLADAFIEYKILMYCKRQRKSALRTRIGGVWRIPQDK